MAPAASQVAEIAATPPCANVTSIAPPATRWGFAITFESIHALLLLSHLPGVSPALPLCKLVFPSQQLRSP
jgi:hypothetical protein